MRNFPNDGINLVKFDIPKLVFDLIEETGNIQTIAIDISHCTIYYSLI